MKLIKGYKDVLNNLNDPFFVTLTVPNVSDIELKSMIIEMFKELKKIQKVFQKRKTNIIGIRKIEYTYNTRLKNYHPHFHLIISGKIIAETLVSEWLKRFPSSNMKGQDIRKADSNSILELFKYFTKVVTGKGKLQGIYIKPMDVIFNAMKGRRVFQPLGVKKRVSEDIEEIQAQEYDIEETQAVFSWKVNDWVDERTGELLTGYVPTDIDLELLSKIVR